MKELRPYQVRAIDAILSDESRYLALDAGLGKSRIAIEIARRMQAESVLIIMPASGKINWVEQVRLWWPEAKYHAPVRREQIGKFEVYRGHPLVTLVNYDKISRDAAVAQLLADEGPFDLLVLDEAHYIKNFDAKRTRNIVRWLVPAAKRVLPMSATPMTRDATDLYTPLRMLKPEAITDMHGRVMSLQTFQDAYCHVEQRFFNGRRTRVVTGSRNLPLLRARMGSCFLRMTKTECLPELPPMQWDVLPIGIDKADEAAIAEATADIDIESIDAGAGEFDAHIASAMRQIGVAKVTPAAQYLDDFLEGSTSKVVVWCRHHDVLDGMIAALSKWNPAVIDGRVDERGRAAAVTSFLTSDDCRVFIGQIAAAGTGLTLLNESTQPRDVFFVECDWSPSNNYQAASRVHRLGQRDGVLVRVIVAQGAALDRRIQSVLTRKSLEIAEIMESEKCQ